MKTALKEYAGAYSKMKAYEAICKDLKKSALVELNTVHKGKAIVDGIEFHKSKRTSVELPDAVKKKIDRIKKKAISDGLAKVKHTNTFDACIPKSTVHSILSRASKEYAKLFKN